MASPSRIPLVPSGPLTPVGARGISLESCKAAAVAMGTVDAEGSSEDDTTQLIESVYGSAMAVTAIAARRRLPWQSLGDACRTNVVPMMVYSYLIGNVCFQGYLLWAIDVYIYGPARQEIRHIYNDFREATYQDAVFSKELWSEWNDVEKVRLCQVPLSQPLLFMVLLIIWTSHVMIDLRETAHYAYVWAFLPHTEDSNALRKAASNVTEVASVGSKALVFLMVLAPKILIAMVLWWLGAQWLTATPSFESLVLNAVALAFIMDVDETMYAALASQEVKDLTTQTLLRVPAKTRRGGAGILTILALTVANVAIPLLYLNYFQTVIPHYRWDLIHPCQGEIGVLGDAEFESKSSG